MIECKFSLDLTKNGIQKTVYAKAGEQNARKLIVTLTHSGCVFVLASQEKTYSAKVFLESGESFDAEVVGNTVQAVIPNAFPEAQVRICELRISYGEEVIFSPMFELIIEESLGNKAVSESLQSGVAFQESLSNSEIQDEEMLDSDYVVVYDSSKGKATRLPWSAINEKLESISKNHEDLEGRNEDNQHSINAIEGLKSILENLRADIDLKASQELVNGLQTNIDSKAEQSEIVRVDGRINDVVARAESINTHFQGEIDRLDEFAFTSFDDVYQRLENLSPGGGAGITPEQAQAIVDNTNARHKHGNKSVLDNLDEENGVLIYNGNTIGGSGTTKRPTAEYVYDFVEDYRLINEGGSTLTLYIMRDEATDEEKALVGKEIADIEFERSTGERVSVKNVSEVDFLPCFSILNHIVAYTRDDIERIAFAALYCPTASWLKTEIANNLLSKMYVTYYTD